MKIRITGRNLPTADVGMETPKCPPNSYWDEMLQRCVSIPQLKSDDKASSGFSGFQKGSSLDLGILNTLKNKISGWFSDTESAKSQAASLLDPTGASNYPFLNKAYDDFTRNPGILTALSLGLETAGSIPVFGAGERTAKAAWKTMTGPEKTARVAKAPFRSLFFAMEAPALGVNRLFKSAKISTPMLKNIANTLNRGQRGWDLLFQIDPVNNAYNNAIMKGVEFYDKWKHPEDYVPIDSIPEKQVGGQKDETCPPGYSKDPVTLKCVKSTSAPENTSQMNVWDSWSSGSGMNPPTVPVPQKTVVDPSGNITTTGNIDIGNKKLYETDPKQNPKTNIYDLKGKCQPGYHKDSYGNCVPNKLNMARDLSGLIDLGINTFAGVSNFFQSKQNQKDWDKQFRQNILPDNRYVPAQANKGYVRTNEGDWVGAGYKTQNFGEYGGTMLKDSNMDKIKIRITGGPKEMAYGGQLGYGFDLGQRNTYTAMPKGKTQTVSDQMPEVPREYANIEAEKGETVYADVDGDGVQEHMKIGGKRHTEGGTPLNVPEGSFVFSDTKNMRIKDEEVLSKFGLSPKKGGYTPAEIAKKYDINKYKAIIEDPNSDSIMKSTAMLMVKNYQKKLAELALIQEEMKGFPQGIPEMCRGVLSDELLNKIDEELAARKPKDTTDPNEREVIGRVQQMAQEEGIEPPTASELSGNQSDIETPEEEVAPEEETEMMYGGDYEYGGDLSYFEDDEVPESEYGGALPQMQQAGQAPPKGQVQWLSPELQQAITTINQQTGKKVIISPRFQSGDIYLPPTQHKQKTGLYGDVSPQEIEEFKKRHQWYFKDHPNWNFSNKNDVLDFQTQYDEKFAKKYNFQYFTGNQKFNRKDGLFGEFTFNAPGLEEETPDTVTNPEYVPGYICTGRDAADKPQIQPSSFKDIASRTAAGAYASEAEAIKNGCPPKGPAEPGQLNVTGKPSKLPFAYMTPDIVGIGVAAGMRGRKYLPYIAETAYEPGRYIPEDWKAKASQLKSLSQQMTKQMGDYMPGQNLQASVSNLYGQNAEALIGAIADVDARNVRGVNAFNQAEMERKDKFNLLRAANATERWKGNVIANQYYDNFLNKKAETIYDRFQNAWNNRMNLGLTNATNKYFGIDPYTGRTIFKGGFGPQDLDGSSSGTGDWASMGTDYTKASTALPGLTVSDYLKTIGKIKSSSTGKYGGTMPRKKQKTNKLLADVLFSGHTLPF